MDSNLSLLKSKLEKSILSPLVSDSISVTEVTQCLRKSYYSRHIPNVVDSATIDLGLAIHDKVQKYFENDDKILCAFEIPIQTAIDTDHGQVILKGRVDAMCNINGNEYLIEFKTTDKYIDEPYDAHINQVALYSVMMPSTNYIIAYIRRKEGIVTLFDVTDKITDELRNKMIERVKKLYNSLVTNTEPDREKGILCSYCNFANICLYTPLDDK